MEKLEQTSLEGERKTINKKNEEKDENYLGLKLLDERIYMGGTGVKYWM